MGGGIQRGRGWREPAPNGKLTSTANLAIRQANLSSGSRVFWPALVRPTLVPCAAAKGAQRSLATLRPSQALRRFRPCS
jgi:hypothetical protein